MHLTFLGATGTVTGSKYLLETDKHQLLVDCGLFQGYKQLRLKNWAAPVFAAGDLDAVVLTHAHIDHSGYLPLVVKNGFKGRVYSTAGTHELCRILLPDSGFLQEEQAKFANRHGFSKHKPALPLYTEQDAERSLEYFKPVGFNHGFEPVPGMQALFRHAGHMIGAASVHLQYDGHSITFSGDLGRPNDPLMQAPAAPDTTDYLVVESTYGDRRHPQVDLEEELAQALRPALDRGAVVVSPVFAVGRAQLMLLLIHRLKQRRMIPDCPVYLDSPMAVDATTLYRTFAHEHRLSHEECADMCRSAQLIRSVEESKLLAQRSGPMIILSASGMATGGRVVHHLKSFASDPNNLILLAGFQAGGTRGASIAAGAESVRIHGAEVPIRAQVIQLNSMSAHADADELIAWLHQMPRPPRRTFITHGEPVASEALRARIEHELGWEAVVPEYREKVEL